MVNIFSVIFEIISLTAVVATSAVLVYLNVSCVASSFENKCKELSKTLLESATKHIKFVRSKGSIALNTLFFSTC
jgi:hypothetical protein